MQIYAHRRYFIEQAAAGGIKDISRVENSLFGVRVPSIG